MAYRFGQKTPQKHTICGEYGAPIEILFGPRSARRIYITDTEPNLTAHRLARKKATDIVIPQHFKDELAPILFDTKATIHCLNGLHGHIH